MEGQIAFRPFLQMKHHGEYLVTYDIPGTRYGVGLDLAGRISGPTVPDAGSCYLTVAVAAPQFVESTTRQSGSMESESRKFVRKLQRLLHFLRLQGPFASNTANRLSSLAFTRSLSP
jgi:hypothetical protein